MKEARFIHKNLESWKQMEELGQEYELSDSQTATKDYIKANNDLSYARTFFPHSNISRFLNGLATRIHTGIHVTDITPGKEILHFFKDYVPQTAFRLRKHILVSLLIFTLATATGFFSAVLEPDFSRDMLGDAYVNMTVENIKNGKPMNVYADSASGPMFAFITVNNIRVSFFAFVSGILFCLGTAFIILSNAVRIGAFFHIFYDHGLLGTALQTVFIHGAFELSAIVIAGAAGFRLGASFMFPGTYSRGYSFLQGAKDSITLIIGLIPFFIIAGFLESYVTRQSEMPDAGFFIIISLSLIIFWGYFFFYPLFLARKKLTNTQSTEMKEGLAK